MGIAVTMFTVLCGHLIKTKIVSYFILGTGKLVNVLVKLYTLVNLDKQCTPYTRLFTIQLLVLESEIT